MPPFDSSFKVGSVLPDSYRLITQGNIDMYAEASGDRNPIHIDPEFARKTELGGTVAHGMLVLAYLSTYMTDHFGLDWLMNGSINIRFKAPARPGDTITISGKITKIESQDVSTAVYCDVSCYNQQKETVITGETKVRIKNR